MYLHGCQKGSKTVLKSNVLNAMPVLKYNLFKNSKCIPKPNCPFLGLDFTSLFCTKKLFDADKDIVSRFYEFSPSCTENDRKSVAENLLVLNNFLTTAEEQSLLNEIEPYLKRLRYQYDHWDHAIHGFRETERLKWNETNSIILNRLKETAFGNVSTLPHLHILDLADNGYIKPHIDSIRFCGNIIAGMSLLSDSVMRFCSDKVNFSFSVLLKRRSLYIMRGPVRHEFTHEILPNENCNFHGKKIIRKRRISVICRSLPNPTIDEDIQ